MHITVKTDGTDAADGSEPLPREAAREAARALLDVRPRVPGTASGVVRWRRGGGGADGDRATEDAWHVNQKPPKSWKHFDFYSFLGRWEVMGRPAPLPISLKIFSGFHGFWRGGR